MRNLFFFLFLVANEKCRNTRRPKYIRLIVLPYGVLQILKANQPFPEVKGEETFLSPDERVFRVHKLVCGGEELLEAATQPSLLSLIKEIRAIVSTKLSDGG